MEGSSGSDFNKQDVISAALSELAARVQVLIPRQQEIGLYSGLAGQLLFLFKLHQRFPHMVDETLFSDALDRFQEELSPDFCDLSSGLAGQAWFLEYLNQDKSEDYDGDLLEEVDKLLFEVLNVSPWQGELEMVLGLGGYAVYAARRAKMTNRADLYEAIVAHFEQAAIALPGDLLAWSQPARSSYRFNLDEPDLPEFNLGLAHGVPGIIAALLPAYSIPSLQQRAERLLKMSCDWLIQQQNPPQGYGSCFGSVAGDHSTSRLGWCYGDLTIALTLARAGTLLDRISYIECAQKLALHATGRDAKGGAIRDAGLCHGHVGLALIFKLINNILPHPAIENAASDWLDFGLKQYQRQGLEAFCRFDGLKDAYVEDAGLLMGYAGIGLGLLAMLDDDMDWVDCLLMG